MRKEFTATEIETLRTEYARLQTVDPCAPTYQSLRTLIGHLDESALRQLAAARIKFVSSMAVNAAVRRGVTL